MLIFRGVTCNLYLVPHYAKRKLIFSSRCSGRRQCCRLFRVAEFGRRKCSTSIPRFAMNVFSKVATRSATHQSHLIHQIDHPPNYGNWVFSESVHRVRFFCKELIFQNRLRDLHKPSIFVGNSTWPFNGPVYRNR